MAITLELVQFEGKICKLHTFVNFKSTVIEIKVSNIGVNIKRNSTRGDESSDRRVSQCLVRSHLAIVPAYSSVSWTSKHALLYKLAVHLLRLATLHQTTTVLHCTTNTGTADLWLDEEYCTEK